MEPVATKSSWKRASDYDSRLAESDRLLLCDPQTSGGLLLAVPASQCPRLVASLEAAHVTAAVIGELSADAPGLDQRGPVGHELGWPFERGSAVGYRVVHFRLARGAGKSGGRRRLADEP